MKLRQIIDTIESKKILSNTEYSEFLKRTKQIKAYFSFICKDSITVVCENISNAIQCYYVNMDDTMDAHDFISGNNLLGKLESGHAVLDVVR